MLCIRQGILGTRGPLQTALTPSMRCRVAGPLIESCAVHRSENMHSARHKGDTAVVLPDFASQEEYLGYLGDAAAMPTGIAVGTADGGFVPVEAPGMGRLAIRGTVIHLTDGPSSSWSAVFTRNKFPGAPVKVGRSRLAGGGPIQAIVVNNKVSNVCSGGDGVAESERVCGATASALGLEGDRELVLPCSTGVIGWQLPSSLADEVVPAAVSRSQAASALPAAKAIMTTDRFPKLRSQTLSNGSRVVGIAKGAGMIEPNMATMLAFVLTDADVERTFLHQCLTDSTETSFNSISVDGDESTSDTAVILSSRKVGGVDLPEFRAAVQTVCQGLSSDIVRNGEGTGHVMRVRIENFPGSAGDARRLGRRVVNSPLLKCAVSANDPNTGRLIAAIGSFLGRLPHELPASALSGLRLTLGGRVIFAGGRFALEGDEVEGEISRHMENAAFDPHGVYPPHQRCVEVGLLFPKEGKSTDVTVHGSDLTEEYVKINGDYRS